MPDLVARIRLAVAMVPAGRVATYGDIARVVGTGPRQVGRALHDAGDGVPWWRVVDATGRSSVADAARAHWAAEGVTVRADGRGVRLDAFRADPHQLVADYLAAGGVTG